MSPFNLSRYVRSDPGEDFLDPVLIQARFENFLLRIATQEHTEKLLRRHNWFTGMQAHRDAEVANNVPLDQRITLSTQVVGTTRFSRSSRI
jgi:hypothetical protein